MDVTPGAETNPYRLGTIHRRDPNFAEKLLTVEASDGRTDTDRLWMETVKDWVEAANRILPRTPLLVTLNVGGLDTPDRSIEMGDYCVEKGDSGWAEWALGPKFSDDAGTGGRLCSLVPDDPAVI